MDGNGARYIIRSRRIGSAGQRELSVIKNIDQAQFDFLVVVLFDEAAHEYRMWRLPFHFVREHATKDEINMDHVLHVSDRILNDSRAEPL